MYQHKTRALLILASAMSLYSISASAGFADDLRRAKEAVVNAGQSAQNGVMSQNTTQQQYQQGALTHQQAVTQIQRDLKTLGYKPGPADGVFGQGTQNALTLFQQDFGHKPNGNPDSKAMSQLSEALQFSGPERKLRQQTSGYSVAIESALAGCAIGGLIGVLAGDSDDKGSNALKGCAIGGAVGGASGLVVQERVKKYKSEEAALDSLIVDARKENAEMSRSIRTAEQVISADRAKIVAVKKKLDTGQITKKEARAEMASVDSNTKYLKSTIKGMKKREKEWNKLADEVRTSDPKKAAEIDKETQQLNRKISSLETTVKDLVKQRKVSVG